LCENGQFNSLGWFNLYIRNIDDKATNINSKMFSKRFRNIFPRSLRTRNTFFLKLSGLKSTNVPRWQWFLRLEC